jgi:hypothetical protein
MSIFFRDIFPQAGAIESGGCRSDIARPSGLAMMKNCGLPLRGWL